MKIGDKVKIINTHGIDNGKTAVIIYIVGMSCEIRLDESNEPRTIPDPYYQLEVITE
jgi:hypothetical protein